MKQERRKQGGTERGQDQREPKRDPQPSVRVDDEPVRRLDGPLSDESLRGKSDGEILQRYEL